MISGTAFWVAWWIFVFLVVFNFVPAVIAYARQHPRRHRLAALNVVSLFSFALWLVLLAWAIGGRRDDSKVAQFLAKPQNQLLLGASIALMMAFSFGSTLYGLDLI